MVTIDLTGRKALVTGGARGIGAGIVRVLAECGAGVAFTHLGSKQGVLAAHKLMSDLTRHGHSVFSFRAAAQDVEAMDRVFADAAERLGGLDIVVPNVGMNWVSRLDELDCMAGRKPWTST